MTRNNEIVKRHLEGLSFGQVAQEFNISRERVRQLVRRAGVSPEQSRKILREVRSRNKVTLRCGNPECGKAFQVDPSDVRNRNRRFCSRRCAASDSRKYSDEYLLQRLRDLADKLGWTPRATDINEDGFPRSQMYFDRFGTLSRAQRLAGLTPNRRGRSKGPGGWVRSTQG